MPNCVYVIMRLQMLESVYDLFGIFMCHYEENDDAFLIGGLAGPIQTLMGSGIRHCRRVVNYRFRPNDRVYLAKARNGLMHHEPVIISIYIVDIISSNYKLRARIHTPAMAVHVTYHLNHIEASYEGLPGHLHPVVIPPILTT